MTAIAGLRGTGDWGTDERPKNFREYIMWRNPNGDTPLFALMSKARTESTDDPEFAWWDEPVDILRLQINFASNYGTTDTDLTVDSVDASTSSPNLNWGLASHLVPGDILMVEPATDAAAFTVEYLEVKQVMSDTVISVRRGACGSTAAAINNDVFLLKIGTAFSEGTAEPKAASRNPMKWKNFTQIFKTVYDVTGTSAQAKARTGDLLKNERKRRAFDHSRDIEFALMFGRASETTGDNGKPKRTMDGLRRFIPAQNTTVFTGAVTWTGATNNFLDAVYKVFDWNTGAGDTRVALCGNLALNILNKIIAKDTNTQIQYGPIIKQYGMNLRELILPQGSLYLKTHPLLNRHSLYSNSMWIVDFSAIKWRPMKGRDTKFQDDIQQKGEDAVRGQWMTEGGLEVNYGGLTMAYLGNFVA